MKKLDWIGIGVAVALMGGCSQSNKLEINNEDLEAQWQSQQTCNGTKLNGTRLNGVRLNGIKLNGIKLNGIKLNGIKLNGIKLNGIRLNGTSLNGTLEDTQITIAAADLNNTTMEAEAETGDGLVLRTVSVVPNPVAGKPSLYFMEYLSEDTGWTPICGTDGTNPIAAVPQMKVWQLETGEEVEDPTRFTMSCVNAALGKCEMWGYDPHHEVSETNGTSTETRSLAVAHQACQRMVRADYCGDGVPHTRNGTTIDVYDTYNLMTPELAPNLLEADWRADGAHCIRHTRYIIADTTITGAQTDLAYIQANCPKRLATYVGPGQEDCNEANSSFEPSIGFGMSDQKQRSVLRDRNVQGN